MSDPIDIKALDEYLKGDSDVSQRYRELGRDEVSPELDRRVLAEARAAVTDEGTKRSRSWLRWSAPVALAASVVLVVTVVLESGVQKETAAVTQASGEAREESKLIRDKAANETAEAKRADELRRQPEIVQVVPVAVEPVPALPDVAPPPTPTVANVEHFRELAAPEATVEQQAGQLAAVPAAPAAAPLAQAPEPIEASKSEASKSVDRSEAEADSSAEVQEAEVSGSRMRRAPVRATGPRPSISGSSLAGPSRPAVDEPADPQAWLEDIRAMRRAGKTDEADREWERFREAFPDFRVADDDIARKKP